MKQPYDNFIELIQSMANVQKVEQTQKNEFVITTSTEAFENDQLDLQILQLCHKQQWQYSQLTNGKTLENRLF